MCTLFCFYCAITILPIAKIPNHVHIASIYKAPTHVEMAQAQSPSELDPPPCLLPPSPRARDVLASSAVLASGARRPRRAPSDTTAGTATGACEEPDTIPLHLPQASNSMSTMDVAHAMRLLLSCFDICLAMVVMHTTSTDVSSIHFAQRKKLRGGEDAGETNSYRNVCRHNGPDEEDLEHPHVKQVFDLLAWHIGVLDAKWYVKPRSTCWFEEYLFNIYTPDMFYDILRMRRRTFDRLVHDLRPFIRVQQTHWRQPIGVEKKVVVTLFKLMHGAAIPLVADKAALGKSTVGDILRQVCGAISKNFGHLIAWPTGRRLTRIATGFQSKQWLPNCIGAIDGSHIYIASPSNTIVAADHRNRNKSFSILLQGVVDSKCYFTSINTGPPGSLHDSAHFRSTELYRKVQEGTMGGFHDDPLTWPSALPSPPTSWPTVATHY